MHFLGTPQAFVLSQDQTLRQRSNCQRHKATDKTFRSSGCKPFIQGPAITNLAALLDLEVTQKTNRQTFAHSVTLFGCQGARTPPLCSCLVAGICSAFTGYRGAHSLLAFALARQRHPSLYPTLVSLSRPFVKKLHRIYELSDQEPTDKQQREGCAALLSEGLESKPAKSLTSTSPGTSPGPSAGGKVNIPQPISPCKCTRLSLFGSQANPT